MIRESSRAEVPRARRERMSRSRDTVGSADSIFATRDWLDRSDFARPNCVMRRCRRRTFRLSARRSFSSTYASSSSVRPRNSLVVPTFHPFASRRFLFSSRILVSLQPFLAGSNHALWSGRRLFREYLENHDRIYRYVVDHSPRRPRIFDPQLVAPSPDRGHRARVREAQRLTRLQLPQQVARLHPRRLREWRRPDLSVQPDQRLVFRAQGNSIYV
jgi:hypothetical protein